MKNHLFLREAIRSFRSTGAVASSSPALIRKLIAPIPVGENLRIVELGPGNGCVSRALLDRLGPTAELHAFEINPKFVEIMLSINDNRLTVLPTSAERLTDFFAPDSVDFVVSSLPLSMMPKPVKEVILQQSQRVLKPAGRFLQFQYALQDYSLLKGYFNKVNVGFTLANLPPAFVYTCSLGIGL